jgi:cytidylate kinase
MIRTIAIEREYGGGGAAIAKKLAARLGWKLWDEALTEEIARRARVDKSVVRKLDERVDPPFYRLARTFLRGSFERSLPVQEIENFDCDSMVQMLRGVIEEAAKTGNCVIVGRGAPYFLRDRPDTLRLFIYAPWHEKVRRIRALGKSHGEAEDLLLSIDHERSTFVKRYFGKKWPDMTQYEMMINSTMGDDSVLEIILGAVTVMNNRT